MATQAQLYSDLMGWLDRSDIAPLIPGWISMVETDIATQLRARCMVKRATQPIDANFIQLPDDWLHWESIKDYDTGANLSLEDDFTGPGINWGSPATAFRIVGNCIEFLPHPTIPIGPTPPGFQFQRVNVSFYQRPRPLQASGDTNAVLESHYGIYLWGACKYGAMFELDDARAAQAAGQFDNAVFTANAWKASSDFSGGPLRAVVRGF